MSFLGLSFKVREQGAIRRRAEHSAAAKHAPTKSDSAPQRTRVVTFPGHQHRATNTPVSNKGHRNAGNNVSLHAASEDDSVNTNAAPEEKSKDKAEPKPEIKPKDKAEPSPESKAKGDKTETDAPKENDPKPTPAPKDNTDGDAPKDNNDNGNGSKASDKEGDNKPTDRGDSKPTDKDDHNTKPTATGEDGRGRPTDNDNGPPKETA
ncbi:hypothetical protein BGZ70_005440, partial [Mortierella alpina]